MLQRVNIDGIKFPQLYIAENSADVKQAREHGIPYVKWTHGHDKFVKYLLRPVLERMFPGIQWNKVLGPKSRVKSEVVFVEGTVDSESKAGDYDADAMLDAQLDHDADEFIDENHERERLVDIAAEDRAFDGGIENEYELYEHRLDVFEYIGDISSEVDIEALQKLHLLPKFVGDVADCIRKNISDNLFWTEGYNKKLGMPLGTFKSKGELPNLLIIDVSGSIPDGISSTMISLADHLRSACNADLIITSDRSGWYPVGCELPNPNTIRQYYGYGNESREFHAILKKYVEGREWGHVISFGDNDHPAYEGFSLMNTKVHAVHHYHTWAKRTPTGYGKWVDLACDPDDVEYDTTWCNVCTTRRW